MNSEVKRKTKIFIHNMIIEFIILIAIFSQYKLFLYQNYINFLIFRLRKNMFPQI